MNGKKPWIAEPTPSEWFIQHGAGSYEMNFANAGDLGADAAVPNDRFYVHNRAMPPDLEHARYELHVHGDAVGNPQKYDFQKIHQFTKVTRRYVLDCGANGRAFFPKYPPAKEGEGWLPVGFTDWKWGAMGAAEWAGILLDDIITHAKIDTNNTYTRLRGADHVLQGDGSTQPYSHVFSTSDLVDKGIILAYEMNGRPLPRDHGAPMRVVVPGQGGNVSVKWLVEIYASKNPIPWIPLQYNQMLAGPAYDPPQAPPPMLPKSAFELGWDGTITLQPEMKSVTLYGRAWSSPAAGSYRLYSRATDILGNTQPPPDQFTWNQHGLHYNAHAPHPITVMPLQNMP